MAIAGTGMPSAIRPKEVNVTVRGGPPADGRVRAAASTGDSAREGKAQVARDDQPRGYGEGQQRQGHPKDQPKGCGAGPRHQQHKQRRRSRPAPPRAAPEQQAATGEEKKTGQQARLASIREHLASLAAQPLVRWLSTVPEKVQVEPPEAQLAATETLAPAEARMDPTEVQLAATETLAPAEARREPTEAQLAATETLAPAPTDNCCQKAKVHRWVPSLDKFAKCHDHVVELFSQAIVLFF
jgi:hypothetical protein